MTQQEVPPPSKRKPDGKNAWYSSTIERIIKNPAYMGRRSEKIQHGVYGKTILRCEALVNANTFKRANQALTSRPKRGPQKAKNGRAMLAECLWCLRCGGSMYRTISGPGHMYYRCHGKGSDGAYRRGCGNMIRLDVLDAMVSARMERATAHIFEIMVIPGHDHSADLEEIKLQIRELADLDLPDDEYDARLAELRAERDRISKLPVVDDRTEETDTGISYADMWSNLSDQERGEWLRKAKVKIYALKGSQADVDAIAAKSGLFGPDDAPPDVVDGVCVFMPGLLFRAAKTRYQAKEAS